MLLPPRSILLPSLLALCFLLLAQWASGQSGGVISKTTLGQSQNSPEDLANSLIVNNRPKIGKGEKKEEVDPKKLTSKKSNDTTFSGSLNDMGLDWRSEKLGKPRSTSEADSKGAKPSDAVAEKDPNTAKKSGVTEDKTNSEIRSSNSDSKEQKAKSSTSDEKAAEKEKTSASKPDGNR